MIKIAVAFDGVHFSTSVMEFIKQVSILQPISVTGIFLPQVEYTDIANYSAGGAVGPIPVPLVEKMDPAVLEKNINRFKKICVNNRIEYRVHKAFDDYALAALRKESRYADLLIIGSEVFFENFGVEDLNEYLLDTLHRTECPVLLVPEKFEFPKKNILAYNGTGSSVYAIKQFAYLFPGLLNHETLLVFARNESGNDFPEEKNVEELVSGHFSNLSLLKLHFDKSDDFNNWIKSRKNSILVSGAFGRSAFCQLFKKSFVASVIADHKLPVLLAHR